MWYSKTALCISINLSFRECLTFKWRTWRKVQKVQIPIERGACILHFFLHLVPDTLRMGLLQVMEHVRKTINYTVPFLLFIIIQLL
jgi:hypothetical protein